MKIRVGNVWSWKPTAFYDPKTREIPHTVRGIIIHVNPAHHCFTAEAIVNGYPIRETFKTT